METDERSEFGPRASTTSRFSALCVFAAGLTIRLWHVCDIRSAPFFPMRLSDSLSYHNWAVEIADGNWLGNQVFYQAPLYPYVLAVIYSLFGTDRIAVMIVQAILGATSCVLICDAGTRLHSQRAGVAAGLIMACYAPSIFFDSLIQKTALDQFLLSLIINLIIRWQHSQKQRAALLAGLSTGLLILSRENALVFVASISLGMLLFQRPAYQTAIRSIGVFTIGVMAVLFPVALRNYVVGAEFHLTTSQFGPNFFIGNSHDANGMYQPLMYGGGNAQRERSDATMLAEQAAGRSLSPAEVSRYWTTRTLSEIQSRPARWLGLMGWKVALLCNCVESTDTEDLYSYAEWSTPLRLLNPIAHFGILAPLAILGYGLNRQRRKDLQLLALMLISYAAGVVCFYVLGRYRYPLVPFLCLFAGIGVVNGTHLFVHCFRKTDTAGAGNVTQDRLPRVAVSTGLMISAIVFCNWPVLNTDDMWSITQFNMAVEFDKAGDNEEAIRFYERTLDVDPEDVDAHANMASVFARTGRLKEASREYELALQFGDLPGIHFDLANVYAQRGHPADAVPHYRAAISAMPDMVPAHLNLGVALQLAGLNDEAIIAFQKAADIAPTYLAAHLNLAHALADAGRWEDAADHYKTVLQMDPEHSVAQNCLNMIAETLKESDPAP